MKNGHRWTIRTVTDGSLTVTAMREPRKVRLPADYVAAHTTLGYACTINAAQGVTADTCHTVGSDRLTRQQLYVALPAAGAEPSLLLDRRSRPAPHRLPESDPSSDGGRHPHRDPAARRRAVRPHHAGHRGRPRSAPASAAQMYTDALTAGAENIAGSGTPPASTPLPRTSA